MSYNRASQCIALKIVNVPRISVAHRCTLTAFLVLINGDVLPNNIGAFGRTPDPHQSDSEFMQLPVPFYVL